MFDVKKLLFHLSCLFWSCLRQEDKCVPCSSMSTKMEVPLQSELTECLVNARHWLLCMGADLIGDKCWGLREPQSWWKNMPITNSICCRVCSIQLRCSVMCNYLQSHGLQHARPPRPSPTPEACSNSCPSSQWCHPTISSSVILFSSCLQSFPAIGSFLISLFFTSVGQSIGASGSDSVLPMDIQDWFPLALTGWSSVQSKGLSRVLSNTTVQKHQFFIAHHFMVQLSHPYMTTGKITALIILNFFSKVTSLLLKMLSKFVIAFLQTSKHLLIS